MVLHGSCRSRCYQGTFTYWIITKSLDFGSPGVVVLGVSLVGPTVYG